MPLVFVNCNAKVGCDPSAPRGVYISITGAMREHTLRALASASPRPFAIAARSWKSEPAVARRNTAAAWISAAATFPGQGSLGILIFESLLLGGCADGPMGHAAACK